MKTASILENVIFQENRPAITVLFETAFTKEIRIALKQGQAMKEHKTSFPIVIQIVEGAIEFGLPDSSLNLEEGDLIALEGGVPHSLLSQKESIVRLTLTKADQTERVKEVVQD
ncbi:MAG: cupin [Roseivirga sp.]|nr:cupin [Roseivirga sp.]